MHVSEGMMNHIKNWEGLRLKAYKCPARVWTIGYGQTGVTRYGLIQKGMTITQEQADQMFADDIEMRMVAVANMLVVPANQHQFDALVSLAYNIGLGNLRRSTVMRYHNQGKPEKAATRFHVWNKAKGRVLPGLTKRRKVESDWYMGVES